MTSIETLLLALESTPADTTCWLALADALEEAGMVERAELSRLTTQLRTRQISTNRHEVEHRLQTLLQMGVKPCIPTVTNSLGMKFSHLPPGRFIMGSTPEEQEAAVQGGASENWVQAENPCHEVTLTRAFGIGIYPVTQAEYQQVMEANPSQFAPGGDNQGQIEDIDTSFLPVDFVNWFEAVEFCERLSAMDSERRAGRRYRLPTEAEWEFACRGATTGPFAFGNTLTSLQANFDGHQPFRSAEKGPFLARPSPVGSYQPNAFGLYDMHGNVWEWCSDWYAEDYYAQSPAQDPQGPDDERNFRVVRGGSWHNDAAYLRSAYRANEDPDDTDDFSGFRIVLEFYTP